MDVKIKKSKKFKKEDGGKFNDKKIKKNLLRKWLKNFENVSL